MQPKINLKYSIRLFNICIIFIVASFELSAQKLPELIPFRKGQLWGYSDSARTIKIPCIYTKVELFNNGVAEVWNGNQAGIINSKGKVIVPIKYDKPSYILTCINGRIFIRSYNSRNFEVYDTAGVLLDAVDYVPTDYQFREGLIPVEYENGTYAFLNEKWQPAFKNVYFDEIHQGFFSGYAAVKKNGLWGFVNRKGQLAIVPQYSKVQNFVGQYAVVTLSSNTKIMGYEKRPQLDGWEDSVSISMELRTQALIDKQGKTIYSFDESIDFIATPDDAIGKVNFEKKKQSGAFKDIVSGPFNFNQGLGTIVNDKGMRGLINTKAEVIVPLGYADILQANDGLITVWNAYYATPQARCAVLDLKGNKIIDFKHHSIWMFHNGFAVVDSMLENRTYLNGIIDRNGKILVPLKYKSLSETKDWGIYQVGLSGKIEGYIDIRGTEYFED